jgi:hypothetical protein
MGEAAGVTSREQIVKRGVTFDDQQTRRAIPVDIGNQYV